MILEDKSQLQILRQLLLLHSTRMPPGLLKNNEIDYSYPATNDIARLSLIHKVSVLFRTKGPRATRQILEELDWKPFLKGSASRLPPLEEIESYSQALSELTDGVMPAYALNPCRALYMLFYASIARCEKDMDARVKEWMDQVFSCFENSPEQDVMFDTDQISRFLQNSIIQLKRLRDNPARKEDCNRMIHIAELLQKAAAHPIAFLPLLKRPLRSHPSDSFIGQDIFNVHFEKSERWLHDYFAAWKGLSTQYMALLEQTLKKNGRLKEFANRLQEVQHMHKELLLEAEGSQKILLEMLRRLRPLQEMLSTKQTFDSTLVSGFLENMKNLENKLITYNQQYYKPRLEKIGTFVKEMEQFSAMLHPSIPALTVPLFLQNDKVSHMHLPYNCWLKAFFGIQNALRESMNLLELSNQGLVQHIPSELLQMNSPHVTLADLLEYQQRAISSEKRPTGKEVHLVDAQLALLFAEIRRFPRSPDAKDLANRMPIINGAEKLIQGVKADPHYRLLKMVINLFKMPNGPAWFFRNPHAAPKCTPELEARFFQNAFPVLIRSFLAVSFAPIHKPFETAFKLPVQEHEKECVKKMQQAFGKIAVQFEAWQSSVKGRTSMDIAQFIEELRSFMGVVDQEIEKAAHLMSEQDTPSAGLKALKQQFDKLKESIQTHFENHFLSFCTPFIRLIEERELFQETHRIFKRRQQVPTIMPPQKEAVAEIKPVQQAKTRPPCPPPPSPTIASSYQTLEQICAGRFADSKGFQTSAKPKQEELLLLTLQQKTATTLHSLMEDLRELIGSLETHGNQPIYLLQLHTRIAILLEQASKHVAANLKISISDKEEAHLLTFQQGKECFWKIHAPLKIIQEVEERVKPSPWKLNEPQKKLLANLERVVAISSRYPGSCEDTLSASLAKSLSADDALHLKQYAANLLQEGLDTCIAILQPVATSPQKQHEILFSTQQLEQWLTVPAAGSEDGMDAIHAIEQAVRRLEAYRFPQAHRAVPLIDEWDSSVGKRLGTIDTTLRNLRSSARICRSLLVAEVEPSLVATLGTSCLLQEAVLIEQMQLSLLSLLPHASLKNPDQHFLYDKALNRYSHNLKLFSSELPGALSKQNVPVDATWLQKMQERSSELEPFLKELYRYRKPGMPLLDKLYGLSALRDRIVRGKLTPHEATAFDSLMKVNDPIERLEKLDSQIIEVFHAEIRQPLIDMLWLVAEGLNIHEQLALRF